MAKQVEDFLGNPRQVIMGIGLMAKQVINFPWKIGDKL